MKRIIDENFYKQSAPTLAPQLLNKYLCRKLKNGEIIKAKITETECYYSVNDSACHAYKGKKTARNEMLYKSGGYVYVYLCYGIHYLLNVVSGEEEHPEGVMIRGIEGYIGPGKVTKYLKIDKFLNGINLLTNNDLWIEDNFEKYEFTTGKRVGIDYATEEDRNKLWRFILKK